MRDASTRELDAWGAHIHIGAADDEHLDWLDQFFPASSWCGRPDQIRFATVRTLPPERPRVATSGAATTIFSLDHAFESHPLVARRDTACDYHDVQRAVRYRFESRERLIELIPFEHAHAVHMPLLRAVRELVSLRALSAGEVPIHGASFDVGGRGVVLAGPKRAGKTSLLLYGLRAPGTALVGSDRAFVRDTEAPCATGIPTLFKVRHSTARRFPRLTEPLLPAPSLATPRPLATSGSDANEDIVSSPGDAARKLGVPMRRDTRLATVVFITQTAGAGRIGMRRLDVEEAQHRLFSEALFRTATPLAAPQAFSHFARWRIPSEEELARACARLAARVRVVECAVGADALRDASDADATDFVEALIAGR